MGKWARAIGLFVIAAVIQGVIRKVATDSLSDIVKNQDVRDIAVVLIWLAIIVAVFFSPLVLARLIAAAGNSDSPAKTAKIAPKGQKATGYLEIIEAFYGTRPHKLENVTTVMRAEIANDAVDCIVNNGFFGMDPAPDVAKTLTVRYSVDGQEKTRTWAEGDRVRIP